MFDGEMVQVHWNKHHTINPKIVVADRSKAARIINLRAGLEICQDIRWNDKIIGQAQWYPSAKHLLYTADLDGNVAFFDIRSARGALAQKKLMNHRITAIRPTSDGNQFLISDEKGNIKVFDAYDWKKLSEYKLPTYSNHMYFPPCVRVFEEEDIFFAINHQKAVEVVKFAKDFQFTPQQKTYSTHVWDIHSFAFRQTFHQLIVSGEHSHIVFYQPKVDTNEEDDDIKITSTKKDTWD
ncbi:unnamed protein product [Caenorhabditis bovis]|uniref:Uncharacterized protein n=1 Tax=Caenorhabditis bovis TaxID=2654633 RepID=A0A8S1F1U9_9PELO|nr:unnamed protein product [Caenorhabditis bovis]